MYWSTLFSVPTQLGTVFAGPLSQILTFNQVRGAPGSGACSTEGFLPPTGETTVPADGSPPQSCIVSTR